MLNLIRLRHLLPGFAVHGLALLAALSLAGCGASAEAAPPDAPTASPTPWPTLAAVGSAQAVAELRPEETPAPERAGPQLVDQFRAEVLPNAASVFPLEGLAEYPVRVEVIVLTGDLDPVVMISNPAGDQLAYSNTGRLREPEVIGQFIFPADGFYELGVAAAQGTGEVGVSVYRLDPQPDGSWSITRVTFDTTRPNGILVAPDQRTLFVAQSEAGEGKLRELRAYPINDDGSLGPHQVLHNFYPHRGIDGMCWDSDGNIVATAGWDESGPGSMIYVFAQNGRVLETHPLPVDHPTNCTFGGPELSTLYVTTARGYLLRAETTR